MQYIYIYDITNGKILAKTESNANYKKIQDSFEIETGMIYSERDLKNMQLFQYRVNPETKQLERKPI